MLYKGSRKHQESIGRNIGAVVGKVQEEKRNVADFFSLQSVNDSLVAENARLRQKLFQEEKGIPFKDSIGNVTYKKDSIEKNFRYHYWPAKIIEQSFDEKNNYATLNRGAYQGVKRGMAVLSPTGVIGQVVSTSAHYSVAKCIISERFRVSAQTKEGDLGTIAWPNLDSRYVELTITPSATIKLGDSIYTSTSSMFPAKVLIGRAIGYRAGTDASVYTLALSTNFRKVRYAYIVEDISADEVHAVLDTAKSMDKPANPKEKKP